MPPRLSGTSQEPEDLADSRHKEKPTTPNQRLKKRKEDYEENQTNNSGENVSDPKGCHAALGVGS